MHSPTPGWPKNLKARQELVQFAKYDVQRLGLQIRLRTVGFLWDTMALSNQYIERYPSVNQHELIRNHRSLPG
jgi:hypothetical protein